MGIARSTLLWASTNRTLRRMAPRVWFVRGALRKFMPGETLEDGLEAAATLRGLGIPTLFTHLGENVADEREAVEATEEYLRAIDRVEELGLDTEMSVKLTHLGLDLDVDLAADNYLRLVRRAAEREDTVWIDMESSEYVSPTLEVYRRTLEASPNAGLCLQAYLHRTRDDLEALLSLGPSIRMVKGAYREPPEEALQERDQIDEAFLGLSVTLLKGVQEGRVRRFAPGSHDLRLLGRVATASRDLGVAPSDWEIQMLYGIRHEDQLELARRGYPVRTLISYGPAWYPWYVRRLAEKPGENIAYVLRNVFAKAP